MAFNIDNPEMLGKDFMSPAVRTIMAEADFIERGLERGMQDDNELAYIERRAAENDYDRSVEA